MRELLFEEHGYFPDILNMKVLILLGKRLVEIVLNMVFSG